MAAAEVVARWVADATNQVRVHRERRAQGASFREVAHAYLCWLADVKGATPSTLRDYGYVLAGPGVPRRRGTGVLTGHAAARRWAGNCPSGKTSGTHERYPRAHRVSWRRDSQQQQPRS